MRVGSRVHSWTICTVQDTEAHIWAMGLVSVLLFIVSQMNAFLDDATINRELPWHYSFCHVLFFSLLAPDQYQSEDIYFTNLCGRACICSQTLTARSGVHMERIVAVMSGGGCPAAYRGNNVQDHMVRNHTIVRFNLFPGLHSHTRTARRSGQILHINKWMHTRTPSMRIHKSPPLAHTHAQLMRI